MITILVCPIPFILILVLSVLLVILLMSEERLRLLGKISVNIIKAWKGNKAD